jgi:hypothetical protein
MRVARGAGDHTPPEIPEDLRDDFLDQMWRAHEAQRRGDVQESQEIVFDAYVDTLKRGGWILTRRLLREQIPAWMLDCAVRWQWRWPSLSCQDNAKREGVPSPTLGWSAPSADGYMSLVFPNARSVKLIRNQIAHRIAYREAKERLHEVTLHALLKQICQKKKSNIDDWLIDHHIDRSQYYVSKKAGGKPVESEVSVDVADKASAAILREAVEFGLITVHDALELRANSRCTR